MYSSFQRRHKRDATHGEVAKTLEAFGWSVEDLSKMGRGITDLLVGRDNVTDLVEVKSDASATYTDAQVKFRERWRGAPPIRLENKGQAEAWCRRTIRDRQAQAKGCIHRALTPVVHTGAATAEVVDGRYSGPTRPGG